MKMTKPPSTWALYLPATAAAARGGGRGGEWAGAEGVMGLRREEARTQHRCCRHGNRGPGGPAPGALYAGAPVPWTGRAAHKAQWSSLCSPLAPGSLTANPDAPFGSVLEALFRSHLIKAAIPSTEGAARKEHTNDGISLAILWMFSVHEEGFKRMNQLL